MTDEESLARNWFSTRHVKLKGDWLRSAVTFLDSNDGDKVPSINDTLWELFIHSDLRESYQPPIRVPVSAKKAVLVKNHVFQVEYSFDITRSYYEQYRECTAESEDLAWFNGEEEEKSADPSTREVSKCRRMLRLSIGDGSVQLAAIEFGGLKGVDANIIPGMKILTIARVTCRQGVLLLNDTNCVILGGDCDSLYRDRAKMLADKLGLSVKRTTTKNPPLHPRNRTDANVSTISPFLVKMPRGNSNTTASSSKEAVCDRREMSPPREEADFASRVSSTHSHNYDTTDTGYMSGVSHVQKPIENPVSEFPPPSSRPLMNGLSYPKPYTAIPSTSSCAVNNVNKTANRSIIDRQQASIVGILRSPNAVGTYGDGELKVPETLQSAATVDKPIPYSTNALRRSTITITPPRKKARVLDTDIIPAFVLEDTLNRSTLRKCSPTPPQSPRTEQLMRERRRREEYEDPPIYAHSRISPYRPSVTVKNETYNEKPLPFKKPVPQKPNKFKEPPAGSRLITEFLAPQDISRMSSFSTQASVKQCVSATPKVSLTARFAEKDRIRRQQKEEAERKVVSVAPEKHVEVEEYRTPDRVVALRGRFEEDYGREEMVPSRLDSSLQYTPVPTGFVSPTRVARYNRNYDFVQPVTHTQEPNVTYVVTHEPSQNPNCIDFLQNDSQNQQNTQCAEATNEFLKALNMNLSPLCPTPTFFTPIKRYHSSEERRRGTSVIPMKRRRGESVKERREETVREVVQERGEQCEQQSAPSPLHSPSHHDSTIQLRPATTVTEVADDCMKMLETASSLPCTLLADALTNRRFWMLSKKILITPLYCNVIEDLRAHNSTWILKVDVSDESARDVSCTVASALLHKLLGFTVEQCKKLHKINDDRLRQCKRRAVQVQSSFTRLDLILSIEMSNNPVEKPIIVDIATLGDVLKLNMG